MVCQWSWSREDGDQQLQLQVLASDPAERYIGIELGTDGEWWEDGGMGGWGEWALIPALIRDGGLGE